MDAIMPITRGITWNHAPKITRLRDSFCHITNRWLGYRHFAETSRKYGGCHIARNLAIWRAKTRHFRAEESCNGISAAALHREFCAVYFRFNPSDKEDRMYTCCRRRWKVLHARSNSDYSENGSRKWGMRTYVCVLLHELKGLLEKATDCLVVSEGCLYIVGIDICFLNTQCTYETSSYIGPQKFISCFFFCLVWCVLSCLGTSYVVVFSCLLFNCQGYKHTCA